MKPLFIGLILIFATYFATAQTISGTVKDAVSGLPLVGANVSMDGTMQGMATGKEGRFKINTDKLPLIITVSYIGYESQKITISDFNSITILLKPEEEKLAELVITDKPIIEKVFKKDYTIKDYEFYEDYIILLVYKGFFKKHSLILSDMEGNQLSELSIKQWKPIGLFAGCLGGVHLMTGNNARQIYVLGKSIHFLNKVNIKIFEAQMTSCVDANEDYVFYKITKYANQYVQYLKIKKADPSDKKMIVSVVHEKKLELLEDEGSFQALRKYVLQEHNAGQPIGSTYADDLVNADFVSSVIYKPIYVPLYAFRDTVYLFNHVLDRIVKYNIEGEGLDSTSVDYHKDKKWRKQIYFDHETGKAYTLIDTKWAMTLHQINLETGKISPALLLDRPHIENIKIKDGFIYFLYFAPQHGVEVKRLEKMRLY